MALPDSYYQSTKNNRLRDARRVYKTIITQGKEAWWKENGLRDSYYRKFIGEKNFSELIEDINIIKGES